MRALRLSKLLSAEGLGGKERVKENRQGSLSRSIKQVFRTFISSENRTCSCQNTFLTRAKRASRLACSFRCGHRSDGALNLVGTQASCTDINMARSSVNDRLHALDVGLPCTVCTSVRMGDLNTERNTLAADIALCHQLHLLATLNHTNGVKRRAI